MNLFIIVETDNFGGDYPDEAYLSYTDSEGKTKPLLFRREDARRIADAMNADMTVCSRRYWKVAPHEYKLQGGFEP